ncbi:MAG: AAA family ATPase [Janthinobacterium lividum]
MKLKSFRVTNYRSIIDSKECFLSPSDGITILAGQNESGKSSLLEALKHYESNTPCLEAYRDEEDKNKRPKVYCTYIPEDEEDIFQELISTDGISDPLKSLLEIDLIAKYIKDAKEIKLERVLRPSDDLSFSVVITPNAEITSLVNTLKQQDIYKSLTERNVRQVLGSSLFKISPVIILFDEFFDTLPAKFYLDELASEGNPKGLQAVNDIGILLDTDFSKLVDFSDEKVDRKKIEYKEKLTLDFNKKWRQRVGNETGTIISVDYKQGGKDGRPYLRFLIETREGEALPPEKRSLGFKWFLSFYLHLSASNMTKSNMVMLFDEPGLHLHSRAQHDMLEIFEELSEDNQIIYATHSPYLIDTEKLHRLRLIFNSKSNGTTVEKITTKISPSQRDSAKPIIDALGLSIAHNFSAAKDKNVIVEGISDYYYLTAAKKLLDLKSDFYFMPAMGASNAHLLMELCIGWGLKWLMIFDEKGTTKEVNKIKKNFFPYDDTADSKIYKLEGCDGIEDIFEESDIQLALPSFNRTGVTLSEDLSIHGGKALIGWLFLSKAQSDDITWDKLSTKAQKHFTDIFTFIEQGFK